MPVYEYVCKRCRHDFEELVFGDERPACPQCRGEELDKKFSVFGTSTENPSTPPSVGGCGTCGDPRGPGACSL